MTLTALGVPVRGIMLREVRLRYGDYEKAYPVSADSHYEARMQGLQRFLEEFKIPGTPIEYLTKKKVAIEIVVHSLIDKRRIPRLGPSGSFYLEQLDKFRMWVRDSDYTDPVKAKAVKLLLELKEVLSE